MTPIIRLIISAYKLVKVRPESTFEELQNLLNKYIGVESYYVSPFKYNLKD